MRKTLKEKTTKFYLNGEVLLMKVKFLVFILAFMLFLCSSCNYDYKIDNNKLLYGSIVNNNYEAAKEAVKNGADVNNIGYFNEKTSFSSNDTNPTAIALSLDREKIAEYLVRKGSNPNYGYLPVCVLNYNDYGFINFLLDQGADINYTNYAGEYKGETALNNLLKTDDMQDCNVFGYIKMFDYLVKKGADYKSFLSNFDISSLKDYCVIKHINEFKVKNHIKSKDRKALDIIIEKDEKGFKKLLKNNKDKRIPFFTVAYGNYNMVKYICQTKDLNQIKDNYGNSLLFAATVNSDIRIAEYLMRNIKININLKNNDDYNVLSYALALGKENYAKLYLKNGGIIQFEKFSDDENDSLVFAVLNNQYKSVRFLIKNGYPVKNEELVFNAVKYAIDCDNVSMLRFFIENDICSIDIESDSENLLSYASYNDSAKCAEYLIYNKAPFKYFPLHSSIENHNYELTKKLLKISDDINEENEESYTPLMKAVSVGDMDIIRLLVKNGADISHKNRKGENAYDLAEKSLSKNIKSYFSNM